jgi:mannonate dehydratase
MNIVFAQLQNIFNAETMIMAKQLGYDFVHFNRPPIMGDDTWSFEGIKWLKEYCESFGLKIAGVENIPVESFGKIILGTKDRDEQIEKYIDIIKSFGTVGIPLLGHGFGPNFVWRTNLNEPGRGGYGSMSYDKRLEKQGNALFYKDIMEGEAPTREQLFKNYEYFIKAIMPVAEHYEVKIAAHPSDPPIPEVNGIERIFISVDDFERGLKIANSPMWGLNFCIGCFSQMGGEESVVSAFKRFIPRGKIFQVHFRDVIGTGEKFQECFLGEGNINPAKIMHMLYTNNYDGNVLVDHVPKIINDTKWGHIARANQAGYISGLYDMVRYLEKRDV